MDILGSTEREEGPSWARDNWPLVELDPVNAGLDPTLMTIPVIVFFLFVQGRMASGLVSGAVKG